MVSGACKIIKMNTVEIGEMVVYQERRTKPSAFDYSEKKNLNPIYDFPYLLRLKLMVIILFQVKGANAGHIRSRISLRCK